MQGTSTSLTTSLTTSCYPPSKAAPYSAKGGINPLKRQLPAVYALSEEKTLLKARKVSLVFGKVEKDLQIHPVLGKSLDTIIYIIDKDRHQREFAIDMLRCWKLLMEDAHVAAFLEALTYEPDIGKKKLSTLLKQSGEQNSQVNEQSFSTLVSYVRKEIFNNKKVAFSLSDFSKMMEYHAVSIREQAKPNGEAEPHEIYYLLKESVAQHLKDTLSKILIAREDNGSSVKINKIYPEITGGQPSQSTHLLLYKMSQEVLTDADKDELWKFLYQEHVQQIESIVDVEGKSIHPHQLIDTLKSFFDSNVFQPWLFRTSQKECHRFLREFSDKRPGLLVKSD